MSIQRLQSHWGFTRMPFGRDLAPAMLHRHAGHGEAVARISWCVDQRAIGVITGEVGAGKTVAVRAATAALDPSRHVFIYLANPTVGVRGMLTHIVATLGHTPAFHKATLAPQAAETLASEHAERGRNPVLVIDEAHLLDNHQLEAIRLLTNHDMDSGSPFAVILIGQPSLRHRLRLGVLAALDQRIAVRYSIAGMSSTDTADYIGHHCKIAGRSDTLFSEDAIGLIHNASRGHPRAVNNLALHALTAAFAADHPIVDEKAARIAISETAADRTKFASIRPSPHQRGDNPVSTPTTAPPTPPSGAVLTSGSSPNPMTPSSSSRTTRNSPRAVTRIGATVKLRPAHTTPRLRGRHGANVTDSRNALPRSQPGLPTRNTTRATG